MQDLLKDTRRLCLVIDANIAISALIKDSLSSALIFNKDIDLFAPEFFLYEILKYKPLISKKTNRSETNLEKIFGLLLEVVTLIPTYDFSNQLKKAYKFSPDKNDFMYLALAMHLNCPLWSNDKALKKTR